MHTKDICKIVVQVFTVAFQFIIRALKKEK